MKSFKLAVLLALLLVLVAVFPAAAQLGDSDVSSFTIQNIGTTTGQVSVTFVAANGTEYTPADLGNGLTNPFSLDPGAAKQVVVAQIPSAQLPSGSYAVVISSDVEVVAQAGLASNSPVRFTGAYTGFSSGAETVYIPTASYNFSGFYSMISVQNLGSAAANVDLTITCTDGAAAGQSVTLEQDGIPANASYTWALKNLSLFSGNSCDGSAVVEATQPVVAVNNQNRPASGATNTFEGSAAGSDSIFVGGLSNNFSNGWNSALTIQALGTGIDTTVTIDYDDDSGWTDDTCNLTDAAPSCKLFIPNFVESEGRYGATITSDDGTLLLAVVGTTNNAGAPAVRSNAVRGVGEGNNTFALPNIAKQYFGWRTAITCQNVGSVATTVNFSFSGYEGDAFDSGSLAAGQSVQYVTTNSPIADFMADGYNGGATVSANAAGATIACFAGNTNSNTGAGDWTNAFNGFGYDQ